MRLAGAAIALLAAAMVGGCEVKVDENQAEQLGNRLEAAVEDAGNGVEAAAEDAGNTLERAGDVAANKAGELGNDIDVDVKLGDGNDAATANSR